MMLIRIYKLLGAQINTRIDKNTDFVIYNENTKFSQKMKNKGKATLFSIK
jgi:hypothetical protein